MTRLTLIMILCAATSAAAQSPAHDPSDRLRQVLPAAVAERVIARVADARAHGLPTRALEQRALMLAARGVAPDEIEHDVTEHAEHLAHAEQALEHVRGHRPDDDEVEAGAEAMHHGVDGAAVSALARSAPSGRSLAVPLYVIGSLASRGLPSDQALERVRERLAARASDADIEHIDDDADDVSDHGDRGGGHAYGHTKHHHADVAHGLQAAHAHGPHSGPPHGVPANPGHRAHPTHPTHPNTPGRGRGNH